MTPIRKAAAGGALAFAALGGGALGAALLNGSASAQAAAPTTAAASTPAASTPAASTPAASTPAPAPNGSNAPAQGDAPGGRPAHDPSQGGHTANGITEKLLTGDTATKVRAAAQAAVPGATIERVENDAEGSPYEAHMVKADGTHVTVKVDSNFKVASVQDGYR